MKTHKVVCSEEWRLQLYLTIRNIKSKVVFNKETNLYETLFNE